MASRVHSSESFSAFTLVHWLPLRHAEQKHLSETHTQDIKYRVLYFYTWVCTDILLFLLSANEFVYLNYQYCNSIHILQIIKIMLPIHESKCLYAKAIKFRLMSGKSRIYFFKYSQLLQTKTVSKWHLKYIKKHKTKVIQDFSNCQTQSGNPFIINAVPTFRKCWNAVQTMYKNTKNMHTLLKNKKELW